jgi:hypothetical protein
MKTMPREAIIFILIAIQKYVSYMKGLEISKTDYRIDVSSSIVSVLSHFHGFLVFSFVYWDCSDKEEFLFQRHFSFSYISSIHGFF